MLGVGRRGPLATGDPDGRPGSGTASALHGPADPVRRGPQWASSGDCAVVDEAERDAWVVLASADGVGPVTFGRLLEVYGSAAAVLAAARERHGAAGLVAAAGRREGGSWVLAPDTAGAIVIAAREPHVRLEPVRRTGVRPVLLADDAYPARLRAIELPPPVLFLAGSEAALDRPRSVAIVGTRRPTAAGRTLACRIAEAVTTHDATVVSGLALGIDAAAHATAVRCGTPTVAVIGGGHERLYPAAHRDLAARIIDGGGAVVSEFTPDTRPTRGTFPRRNRLISGLADATVVVEAGARSGALTTAAWALEQGRGLHLVPGRPDDPAVAGCLAFLREAGPEARVVAGVAELLEDLGYPPASGPAASAQPPDPLRGLPPAELALVACLVDRPATPDELAASTGLAPAAVLAALTGLEMRGLVVQAFARYRATGSLEARTRVRHVVRAPARPAA